MSEDAHEASAWGPSLLLSEYRALLARADRAEAAEELVKWLADTLYIEVGAARWGPKSKTFLYAGDWCARQVNPQDEPKVELLRTLLPEVTPSDA